MWSSSIAAAAVLFQVTNACKTFGVDFLGGHSYFINSQSNEPFTALTEFTGCSGIASVLLTPAGGQNILCSDIATQPDDTPITITCNILKSQMKSGDWTIGILGNNGDDAPIGVTRLLHLTVGTQATETVIPTVTLSVTETPIVTAITTITDYDSTTLIPATVTSLKSGAKTQTITSKPPRSTITKISSTTVKRTSTSFTWVIVTATVDPVCAAAFGANQPDPTADPSYVAMASAFFASAKATETPAPGPARRLRVRSDNVKVAQVAKRHGAHLFKRAPDSATTTITDSNTADWSTVFSSFTAAPTTVNGYTLVEITSTVTPAPVTVIATKATVTITAKASTRTITKRTTITQVSTKTKTSTYTNTSVNSCH